MRKGKREINRRSQHRWEISRRFYIILENFSIIIKLWTHTRRNMYLENRLNGGKRTEGEGRTRLREENLTGRKSRRTIFLPYSWRLRPEKGLGTTTDDAFFPHLFLPPIPIFLWRILPSDLRSTNVCNPHIIGYALAKERKQQRSFWCSSQELEL